MHALVSFTADMQRFRRRGLATSRRNTRPKIQPMAIRTARSRSQRNPKGVYLDGIGLHQCALPVDWRGEGTCSVAKADNYHSVFANDTQIVITTSALTSLSLYVQGFLGQMGRIHQIAAADQELGSGSYTGLLVVDEPDRAKVRLCFNRVVAVAQ